MDEIDAEMILLRRFVNVIAAQKYLSGNLAESQMMSEILS